MDKMNVISITSDLDALNKDMQDWSFLPMELKMRSNDECIRQYGMTVPSLYNKLKLDILKSSDKDIPSNIKPLGNDSQVELEGVVDTIAANSTPYLAANVPVDANYSDLEKSRELQKNPLIVIIDPSDTEEQVAEKIQSYNALAEKFKRLSDSYSFELYGFNVRNMYKMVLSGIWTSDEEENQERNTLVFGESTNLTEPLSKVENYESIVNGEEDFVAEAFINGDILSMMKYITEVDSYEGKKVIIANESNKRNAQLRKNILEVAVPSTALPWYTPLEQIVRGITPNIASDKKYLAQVKETMDAYKSNRNEETIQKVLELGWNYEIDINPGSIQAAKAHYIHELNKIHVYDIRNFNEYDMIDHQEGDPYPVYFVMYQNGLRMSLDSDLLRAVSPAGSEPIDINGPGKVFVTFVHSLEYLNVKRFKSFKTLEIYDELNRADYTKEQASKIIDAIAQISTKPLVYNKYHYNVYLVYNGLMSEYDYRRTDQIVDTLLHHRDELLKENAITTSLDFFDDMMKPTIL